MGKSFLKNYKNLFFTLTIVALLNASLVLASFNLGDSNHQINLNNNILGNDKQIINIFGLAIGTSSLASYKLKSVGNMYVSGTLYAQNIEGNIQGGQGGTVSATDVSAGEFGANTGGGGYSFPANLTVGQNNAALGENSAVIGGRNSTSSGNFSGIFNSQKSQINNSYSAILGGRNNILNGFGSVIINSSSSLIQTYATYSAIISGKSNKIYGANSAIIAGISNTISTSTWNSAIINGTDNTIQGNSYLAILNSFSCSIVAQNPLYSLDYSIIINSKNSTNRDGYSVTINQVSSTNYAYGGLLLNGNNLNLTAQATATTVFNSFNEHPYSISIPYAFLVDPVYSKTKIGIGTNNPLENLDINGAIKIGSTSQKENGTIKWTGTSFQGYTNQWEDLGIAKGTIAWFDSKQNRDGWTYLYTEYLNTWTTKASMPTARYRFAIGVVSGKIYAIGGTGGLTKNEEYDPSTNTWTTKANMPTGRWGLAIGVVDNKIYAIGGYDGSRYLRTNEEYDPSTNTWTTKANMPSPRRLLSIGVVNGKIYAIGGYATSSTSTNEEYNPSTDSWTTKASMPTARYRFAIGVVNGKIYAIGGNGGSVKNEEYDPSTNTWTTKANMPTGRWGLAIGVVDNKIYAIGGYDADNEEYLSINEEYDPSTNTWTTKGNMITPRRFLSIGTIGSKIYAIGGYNSEALNINECHDIYYPLYVYKKD